MAGLDPASHGLKGRLKGRPSFLPDHSLPWRVNTITHTSSWGLKLKMTTGTDDSIDQKSFLIEVLPKHERLTNAVRSLIENMLKERNIEYLSVTGRVKGLNSAMEKIQRKDYSNAEEQLTDLSGIRIITYLEQQVIQISSVIRDLFEIDEANSLDRSEVLGHDRIGYRSTHFVCLLGKNRHELPEYESLGPLKFEIQVRTVLQHAWAELAHDRSFKFGTALPGKIQRKLNLYSGDVRNCRQRFRSNLRRD